MKKKQASWVISSPVPKQEPVEEPKPVEEVTEEREAQNG